MAKHVSPRDHNQSVVAQAELQRMVHASIARIAEYRIKDEESEPTIDELNRRNTRGWIRESIVCMDDEKLEALVPELIKLLAPHERETP